MEHWEDRITREQHDKCSAALKKFRTSKKRRHDEMVLYDALTHNGVRADEADAIIELELECAE